MLAQPYLQEVSCKTWQLYQDGASSAPGPVKELSAVLRRMGWNWESPWIFNRPSRKQLGLFEGSEGWWLHEVRDGLRIAEWKQAASRRADMSGMQSDSGIDKLATLAFYDSKKLSNYDKGLLRGFLSGSYRTRDRLFAAGLAESPVCQFCNTENETMDHFMWRCPAWNHVRLAADIPGTATRESWPACTKNCGIVLESSELLQWVDQGPDEVARLCDNPELPQDVCEGLGESTFCDEHVVVWTDGASRNNQDSRMRRAGCGVFFGCDNVLNVSCSLPGREQSNQRAELYAVVLALRQWAQKLDIRSDSAYVVEGMQHYMNTGKLRGKNENNDLWALLVKELAGRSQSDVFVVWVRGHAKTCDVQSGRTTLQDKMGNDAADVLATSGAMLHSVPCEIARAASTRRSWATCVQRLFLALHKVRAQAEEFLQVPHAGETEELVGDLLLNDPVEHVCNVWTHPVMLDPG